MVSSTSVITSQTRERSPVAEAFDLIDDPFPHDPGRGVFVPMSSHTSTRDEFRHWIEALREDSSLKKRLGVITGEEGDGKSRVVIELERALSDNDRLRLVTLPNVPSHRTDAQLLKAILVALGAEPVGRSGLELRGEIRDVLQSLHGEDTQAGLLIDDADFKGSQLELIRNLLRDAEGTGLWIILAGTPDLQDRMRRRRSLRSLMGPVIQLANVPETELSALVRGRIDAVHTDTSPESIFTADALGALAEWANGNPGRMIQAARETLNMTAAQNQARATITMARETIRTLTIEAANQARAEVAAATGRPVQTHMPLLHDNGAGSSSATTQRGLWEGDDLV